MFTRQLLRLHSQKTKSFFGCNCVLRRISTSHRKLLTNLCQRTSSHVSAVETGTYNPSIYRSTYFSSSNLMPLIEYDQIVGDTLEEMADYFDELSDNRLLPDDYDCNLADGVMTVYLAEHGTYVINKQTPNRQIWLSSPTSGPKRYDFVDNTWFYSHDPDTSLHELLSKEISDITNADIDFTKLAYGSKSSSS